MITVRTTFITVLVLVTIGTVIMNSTIPEAMWPLTLAWSTTLMGAILTSAISLAKQGLAKTGIRGSRMPMNWNVVIPVIAFMVLGGSTLFIHNPIIGVNMDTAVAMMTGIAGVISNLFAVMIGDEPE